MRSHHIYVLELFSASQTWSFFDTITCQRSVNFSISSSELPAIKMCDLHHEANSKSYDDLQLRQQSWLTELP